MIKIEELPDPVATAASLAATMVVLRALVVVLVRAEPHAEAWLRVLTGGMQRDAVMNGPAETPQIVEAAAAQLVATMLEDAAEIARELPADLLAEPPIPRG